ncbi:MAG: AAA family ATPase [Chloracidobacterium sp.]|nr:AAA family ATPase [Chloracidobacterium sp.]
MTFDQIVSRLEGLKKIGKNFIAICPSHDDGNPSLSVRGVDGRVLLKCHAGCDIESICRAMGISLSELFEKPLNGFYNASNGDSKAPTKSIGATIAEYVYRDADGIERYRNVRHSGAGRYYRKPSGAESLPYRLPELLKARADGIEHVFVCEGEKDCDNVRGLGFVAVSLKGIKDAWAEYFAGMHVTIIQDHDEPGTKQAVSIARILATQAASVRITDLYPSEPMPNKNGKDVSDWIDERRTAGDKDEEIAEELARIVDGADTWNPEKSIADVEPTQRGNGPDEEPPLKVYRAADVKDERVEWLWEPFLPLGNFCLLDGEEGIGKTFLSCALLTAVANGRGLPILRGEYTVPPSNAMIVSAEDSLSAVLKPRLVSMDAPLERIYLTDEVFALSPEGVERLSKAIALYEPRLVIIDPLFSYTGGVNLNNDNEIRSVTDPLKRIAEVHKCTILGIRHIGKSKGLGEARNAGLNGVGWRAAARSHLLIGRNPQDDKDRAICQTKSNLAEGYSKALGYSIRDGRFYWTGESQLTPETILSYTRQESTEERNERTDAMEFLRETLSKGRMPTKEVQKSAREAGISEATLRRAKAAMNIEAVKDDAPNGAWFWHLPRG